MDPINFKLSGTFVPSWLAGRLQRDFCQRYGAIGLSLYHSGLGSINDAVDLAFARIASRLVPGRPVRIIGDSQGGVVAVICGHRLVDQGYDVQVITLGSPHFGTNAARSLAWRYAGLRDMCPGSDFLRHYRPRLEQMTSRVTAYGSTADPVIKPFTSSFVPGARNFLVGDKSALPALLQDYPGIRHLPTTRIGGSPAGHVFGLISPAIVVALNDAGLAA